MMKRCALLLVVPLTLALAACGSSTKDRTISGAGIGAAAGAVVGAVTGLSVLQGVLIGAAAGGRDQVLADGQVGEDLPPLGHQPDAGLGDLVGGLALDANAVEQIATATQTGASFSINLIRSLAGQDAGRVNPVPTDGREGVEDEAEGSLLMADFNNELRQMKSNWYVVKKHFKEHFKIKAIVNFWREEAQKSLCAPGGAGRAADAAAFDADFAE